MARVEAELAARVRPLALSGERTLPVHERLSPLLPGGLRRGTVVSVAGEGHLSLLLSLAAGPSAAGSWCALVGLPEAGPLAAAELGVDLGRTALVPDPGDQWATVVATLIDGVDVVVIGRRLRIRPTEARRLAARSRQRGAVLLIDGAWPDQADLRLSGTGQEWEGLGPGFGHLTGRWLEVTSLGRAAHSRSRRHRIWMGPAGEASADGAAEGAALKTVGRR